MHSARLIIAATTLLITSFTAQAQQILSPAFMQASSDTINGRHSWQAIKIRKGFPAKSLVVPVIMITYGFTALENNSLRHINAACKEELYTESPHHKKTIDNYLQFAPAAAVYGLNALGIKGQHNLSERSHIYALANILVTGTVYSVKKLTAVPRPDGSANSSFPSGHTAAAFASAEFMRLEYKDLSPWYAVAGYAVAATTGYLRMYNNKHWLSDVVAGAGVGVASTRIAYWLYPKIQHAVFKDKLPKTVVMPTYQAGSFGVGMLQGF